MTQRIDKWWGVMLCAIWSLRVFFTFFKLHKWYQIKQRTTIDGLTNWWIHFPLSTVYFLEKTVWFSSFLFTTKLLLVKLLFECLQIARWFVVIGLFIVNRQNKHLLMRHILQRVFTLFSYSASTNFFFEHLFLRPFYLLTRFLSLSTLETSVIFFSSFWLFLHREWLCARRITYKNLWNNFYVKFL